MNAEACIEIGNQRGVIVRLPKQCLYKSVLGTLIGAGSLRDGKPSQDESYIIDGYSQPRRIL